MEPYNNMISRSNAVSESYPSQGDYLHGYWVLIAMVKRFSHCAILGSGVHVSFHRGSITFQRIRLLG